MKFIIFIIPWIYFMVVAADKENVSHIYEKSYYFFVGEDENESRGVGEFCEPISDEQIKPYMGQKFPSEDVAIAFYKKYAEFCEFDV